MYDDDVDIYGNEITELYIPEKLNNLLKAQRTTTKKMNE